jgi:hypothetical protein
LSDKTTLIAVPRGTAINVVLSDKSTGTVRWGTAINVVLSDKSTGTVRWGTAINVLYLI